MKKTMLLGMMLTAMVVGVTGFGNKSMSEFSDEQLIKTYLESDGTYADTIEISEYTGDRYDDEGIQRFDDDYVNYEAYDQNGKLIDIGGVDLSWVEDSCC